MKKIFTLFVLAFTIFSFKAVAQTNTACNAKFNYAISGNSVHFTPVTNNNDSNIIRYWDFGDNNSVGFSVSSNDTSSQTHIYYNAGIYHVRTKVIKYIYQNSLIITCQDSAEQEITIANNIPCEIKAAFTYKPDSLYNNIIHFTDLATSQPNYSHDQWTISNNNISNFSYSPTYAFTASGTYNVCLKVYSTTGCVDSMCQIIQVNVPTNLPCDASFTDSVSNNIVEFKATDTSTVFANNYFDFGDNSTGAYYPNGPATIFHTYQATGIYQVQHFIYKYLHDYSAMICTDSIIKTIAITNVPCDIYAAYSFTRDSIQSNTIHFSNNSTITGTINYVRWYFGDSTYSADYNPTHTFTKSGLYHVCLLVKKDSLSNCSVDTCMNIQVQVTDSCNIQSYFYEQADSVQSNKIHFTNETVNLATTDSSYWDFGDNTTSRDLNPTHIYVQPGTYNACLTITRNTTPGTAPCTSKFCRTIVIQPLCNIKVAYAWKVDSLNQNTIDFTNTTAIPISGSSARWSFGDGSAIDSSWNATHTYTQPGKYYVCLRIQTNNTCINYQCDSITVPAPVCNFLPSYTWQLDSRTPNTVDFTNTTITTVAGASARWFYGDGTADSTWSAIHTFAQPGKYYVCLRVQLNANCYKYQCDSITVPAPVCNIKANYTWKIDSINYFTVHFTNTTIPTVTNASVIWSFGDGSPLDSTWNATHSYTQAGKYYVCLRVQTSANCVSYQCDSITVPATIAECNFQPTYTWQLDSRTPNTVDFTNTTITTVAGASARWFYGDGTSDSTWSAIHTFAQPGKYYICLRVQLNPNCYKYQCDSITVPAPVCNLKADFSYYRDSLAANPNTYHFTNTSTPSDSVYWNFGDGSPDSRDANPVHIYTTSGTYTVCLYIQNITTPGTVTCVKNICETVIVTAINTCNFQPAYTWKVDSINHNTIDFTNTTILPNTNATVSWYFGDGSSATSWNATHQYAQPGKYYACLRVQLNISCYKYQCDSITVPAPIADCNYISAFTFTKSSNDNQVYTFAPIYPATNIEYTWTFGDNDGSLNVIANHRYLNPGNYTACLTAYRDSNCASTTCKEIAVAKQVNCDSINLTYNYYQDGSASNKVYFYTTDSFAVSQLSWTITSLTNPADSPIVITQTNPVYIFNDTGYYNVCLKAVTNGNCIKEYCNTIHIQTIATTCELQAYPNPADTQVGVNVDLTAPELIHAYLYNMQSMLLSQTAQQGNDGTNIITINTQNLAAGFYTIELIYGNRTCFAKFQKL